MTDARQNGHSRTTGQARTLRWLLAASLVVLAVLLNAVAALAVDRFSLKLDLTDAKVYALSPQSRDTLGRLDAPVGITVFAREQDYPAMLREILARYRAASTQVSISYRDPISHPVLVDSYMQRGTRIENRDLVVTSGERFRRYGIKDLVTLDNAGTRVLSVRAEQQVTGAIAQLHSRNSPVVRFSDGHDEQPSRALMDLFGRNNYQVARLTLAVERIADNVDMLVVASARRDFTAPEIADIERFLARGGSLMVFLAPSVQALAQLEALLARWGISAGNGLVFEPRAHVSDNRINIIPMYAQHPINRYFSDKRAFLLMPSARTLAASDKPSFDLDVMTVLSSTPQSYAKSGMDFASSARAPGDRQGPFDLALTATRKAALPDPGRTVQPGAAPPGGRIFVAGSEAVYADDVMGMSNFANAAFMAQVLQWLRPDQQVLQIDAKKVAPDTLAMPSGDALALGAVLTVAVPLLVLLTGGFIMVRRRRAR